MTDFGGNQQSCYLHSHADLMEVMRCSTDINEWLHGTMGQDFSAKDFRTWGATAMAFRMFTSTRLPRRQDGRPASESALAKVENEVVEAVASALGNTRTVCRKSYLDPSLFTAWREDRLAPYARSATGDRQWEHATLRFLRTQSRLRRRSL